MEKSLADGKKSCSFSVGFEECWALPALFRWYFLNLLNITVPSGNTEYPVKHIFVACHPSCVWESELQEVFSFIDAEALS